jgi:hypothetical protein
VRRVRRGQTDRLATEHQAIAGAKRRFEIAAVAPALKKWSVLLQLAWKGLEGAMHTHVDQVP